MRIIGTSACLGGAGRLQSIAMIIALVRDLMFASKITAAANEAGVEYRIVRDPAKLAGQEGEKLLVDLNQDGAIDAAAAWRQSSGKPVVGFVSHVDTEIIERAKSAGIDQVTTRGQFTQLLANLLRN